MSTLTPEQQQAIIRKLEEAIESVSKDLNPYDAFFSSAVANMERLVSALESLKKMWGVE